MGAPTEYYVDPSVAANGGTGTAISPWTRADGQVMQYAADNITRDATNGDRINVKSGTPHTTTTSTLDLLTYGVPTAAAPLWLQGYSSTAGDGGKGTIVHNSRRLLLKTGWNSVMVMDLEIELGGINVGNYSLIARCKVQGALLTINGLSGGSYSAIVANTVIIQASSATGIYANSGVTIRQNYVELTTGSTGSAIRVQGQTGVFHNIIKVTGAADGILLDSHHSHACNNSIYSNGGTGIGINANGTADYMQFAYGNLVEGFSGVGGIGLRSLANTIQTSIFGNSVFDCETVESFLADEMFIADGIGNETLVTSPFSDAATDDFTPVDIGSVLSDVFGTVNGTQLCNYRGAVAPSGAATSSVIVIED